MCGNSSKIKISPDTPKEKPWDTRTRVAVYGQVLLFLFAWGNALSRLIIHKFWDRQYNIDRMHKILASDEAPVVIKTGIRSTIMSYFTTRYGWFLPHVAGSLIWWNLYFLQLVPSIRRKHKKFHRVLGRLLMVCALAQTVSGVGLAYNNKSPTVKIVSYLLAVAVAYCVYYAWYYAWIRDIPKHKYWSLRLVGYLQTIALQRVFFAVLMVCWFTGGLGLYPLFDGEDKETLLQVFDDSFVSCFIVGMMATEWYLAGYYGWTEGPKVPVASGSGGGEKPKAA